MSDEKPKRDDSNVYVLLPSDDIEQQVCRQFWDEKYPTSKAKVVSDLKLQRLTSDHLLVALTRLPPERPKFQRLDGGNREALPSQMPVRVTHPIKISEFWTEEGGDGKLDYLAVVRALGQQVVPLRPAFRPDDLSVKLMMV